MKIFCESHDKRVSLQINDYDKFQIVIDEHQIYVLTDEKTEEVLVALQELHNKLQKGEN